MAEELVPHEPGVPDRSVVEDLTDKQLQAVDLLVQGDRPGMVAHKLGIARETLWRWRQLPAFKDQVVRLRYELHVARVDRIWALTDKAYDVVEEHLAEGDPRVAIDLLRLAGGRLAETGKADERPVE
jgi:hypothetical protein